MSKEDTEAPSQSTSPDRPGEIADERTREDDRNVELDESPVPDPEAKDPGARDDPEAD